MGPINLFSGVNCEDPQQHTKEIIPKKTLKIQKCKLMNKTLKYNDIISS